MVYLDNTTEEQVVYIPREGFLAGAHSGGGGEIYYPGDNINISPNNVISVTGMTEAISAATSDFVTSADVHSQIEEETSDFVTSGTVETMISTATENLASETYVDNAVSGKASTQYVDNAVSGKADTTAVTEVSSAVTTVSGEVYTLTTWVQGCMSDIDTLKTSKADTTAVTQSINNAVSGLASTQYVDNSVSGKADTTAVTEALSSYTPTSGFATINGSAITEGGNIEIQGGGDSTALEEITELPESPVDGAVYNYNGVLIKYVNGAGKWGEWLIDSGNDVNIKSTPGNGTSFTYAGEIPSSMDGLQMCRSRYFTSNIINWFFDLQNDRIVGKVNDVDTYYVVKNGSPITAETSFYSQRVAWVNNKISFVSIYAGVGYGSVYPLVDQECSVETNDAHYELVEPASAAFNYDLASGYSSSVFVTEDGRIRALGIPLTSKSTRINDTFRNYVKVVDEPGLPFMSVPETTGETGTLCVSSGGWDAPIWKTVTQVLGIDFWTGTQDEYDAITTKSATTLYIIIPDNS